MEKTCVYINSRNYRGSFCIELNGTMKRDGLIVVLFFVNGD